MVVIVQKRLALPAFNNKGRFLCEWNMLACLFLLHLYSYDRIKTGRSINLNGRRKVFVQLFHGIDVDGLLKIKGNRGYGISLAVAKDDEIETYCSGSGRYGQDFPVDPDMLFQAGSVSKPMFALTLLRYADRGLIDLDADISGVLSDFVSKPPMTFPALLSHTAGYSVGGFRGYRANAPLLSLEDVVAGRGNSKKVVQIRPYGKQYKYSGGGITMAELAFTRLAQTSLRDAFQKEVAEPLGLTRTGYFQPLDEDLAVNAAFGGRLAYRRNEDSAHGYHYHPEHAAAGLWATPAELTKIGIALSRSFRNGGMLEKKTAERMAAPISDGCGLCLFRNGDAAYHYGSNEGFLTFWKFSLKEDLCVAGMVNTRRGHTFKAITKIQNMLFESLQNTGAVR